MRKKIFLLFFSCLTSCSSAVVFENAKIYPQDKELSQNPATKEGLLFQKLKLFMGVERSVFSSPAFSQNLYREMKKAINQKNDLWVQFFDEPFLLDDSANLKPEIFSQGKGSKVDFILVLSKVERGKRTTTDSSTFATWVLMDSNGKKIKEYTTLLFDDQKTKEKLSFDFFPILPVVGVILEFREQKKIGILSLGASKGIIKGQKFACQLLSYEFRDRNPSVEIQITQVDFDSSWFAMISGDSKNWALGDKIVLDLSN